MKEDMEPDEEVEEMAQATTNAWQAAIEDEMETEKGSRRRGPLGQPVQDGVSDELSQTYDLEDDDCTQLAQTLHEAFRVQVWEDEVQKAPRSWDDSSDVPDFVKPWIGDVISMMDPMWGGGFADIPETAQLVIHEEIADSLTQDQGWSINSIINRLVDDFGWLETDHAEVIVRQEVAAVLNKAKEVALRSRSDADQMIVRWDGPDDASTTVICETIKERVEEEGGAVTVERLQEIVEEVSREYTGKGGTPERVAQWVPHYECRHTLETVELEELGDEA